MKRMLLIASTLMLFSSLLGAQPQGERPAPPTMKSPAEMAKEQTELMQGEVGLDKKQCKKVYKLFKKDFQYRQNNASKAFQGGMPPQGGGPGMGGSGMGGPGMGGGMMMGGGPGMGGSSMGGGRPPQGNMQPGQRPDGAPQMGPGESAVSEEYLEKQDAKLRKILSEDQYAKWRSKHPSEHLELPPIEIVGA